MRGTEINSLMDLILDTGQPSGPGDLLLFISLLWTTLGMISIESSIRGELAESTVGIVEVSSQVKTLEK